MQVLKRLELRLSKSARSFSLQSGTVSIIFFVQFSVAVPSEDLNDHPCLLGVSSRELCHFGNCYVSLVNVHNNKFS